MVITKTHHTLHRLPHYLVINVRKQAINDRLQGSVATYLRSGGVLNNQIKKDLLMSLSVKSFLKSVNIWHSYKHERGCLVHFVHLATTLLKDKESARDNHVLAHNFAKYSLIKKTISLTDSQ